MSTIYIFNISETTEDGFVSYTFPNYFADESTALKTVVAMAEFWAQNQGGTYVGYVKDEDAYCVRKGEEFVKFYSIQSLTSFETENIIERIC